MSIEARAQRRSRGQIADRLRRWQWTLVLGVGLALFELTRQTELATANPRLLPGLVLLGALVAPATCVAFIWPRATNEISPVGAIIAGLGGGVIAVLLAAIVEHQVSVTTGQLPPISVAVIEEVSKLIVPFVVLLLWKADAGLGLALGVAVGAGFALVETLGYAFVTYVGSADALAAVDLDLLSRSLFTPATHLAWTGVAACALGALCAKPCVRRAAIFLAALVVAVILHASWDTWGRVSVYIILSAVSLALLVLALRLIRGGTPPVHQPVGSAEVGVSGRRGEGR